MNIVRELVTVGRIRGDAIAIDAGDETLSYRALLAAVDDAARAFAADGIAPGDRVALLLPNVPAFAIAYYGLLSLGAVAVSVNMLSRPDELRHILVDSGARAIVTTDALASGLPPRETTPALQTVFTTDGANGTRSLRARDAPPVAIAELARDAPAAILYTSGTTGRSKGAVLSHANVVSNVHTTRHLVGTRPDDQLLCFLPLFHCFGQDFILNAALYAGATLHLHRRFVVDDVLATLVAKRITVFFGVPTAFIALLAHRDTAPAFASVRYCFSAAAILPTDVERAWHARTGLHIHEGYGLTETSPFASYNHALAWRPGSIGTPIDNVEMRVVDEHDRPLSDGQIGEICIRGPNVMLGYFNRPDETARAVIDGWFHSGDIGYRDEDGYYFIVDRLKDMINAAGFKVWPREVEEVLFAHETVRECAVVGVADAYAGEAVKAFVVLRDGCAGDAAALVGYCAERLSKYKVPREIEFVAAIPKNATGKVLKKDLRR